VYCPRCGAQNEPHDRYCSACGAGLRGDRGSEQSRSPRERLAALIGTTRKARLLTAATALAIVVAIAAFIALDPDDDEIPRDGYTVAADQICLDSKRGIVAARLVFQRQPGAIDPGAFARTLVPVVGRWRAQLNELTVPLDRVVEAQALETALLEAEVRIAKLARIAARGGQEETLASARRADEASSAVEEAASDLGLDECANAAIGFTPDPD
jgi:zinc-ribbon domain